MSIKNKEIISELSSATWGVFKEVVLDGKYTQLDLNHLNGSVRQFDKDIENISDLKVPVSIKAFEKIGVSYFNKISYRGIKFHREHIIDVDSRIRVGIDLIKNYGFDKYTFYDWLIETLYLVYKLRSEHNESINGGALAEQLCLSKKHHQPQKWKTFKKVLDFYQKNS